MDSKTNVFDNALLEVGNEGRYQKFFDFIYGGLFLTVWYMTYCSAILVVAIPAHHCKIPPNESNLSDIQWKTFHIPSIPDKIHGTEGRLSQCLVYVNRSINNVTKACTQHEYDKTWFESTVASENDWVCQDEINISIALVWGNIAEVFGSAVFGWFGDKYGRRPAYILGIVFIVVGRLMTIALRRSFLLFTIGNALGLFPSWSLFQTVSSVSIEMSSAKRVTWASSIRFFATTVSMLALPLLYWWLRSWKLYTMAIVVLTFPFFMMSWSFRESPHWLWLQGKRQECVTELKRIAKWNKTTLSQQTEHELLSDIHKSEHTTSKSYGILALFSNTRIALNTIIMSFHGICIYTSYGILLMSLVYTKNNPFLEFSLQSLIEVPANFIGAYMADKIGRRHSSTILFTLSAVIWTIYLLQFYFVSLQQLHLFGSIMLMLIRLVTATCNYVFLIYNIEIFPICIRQSGLAFTNSITCVTSAFTPYIVFLGQTVNQKYPSFIMITASVVAAIGALLLPETLNAKLPETLEDTKTFGSKIYIPLSLKKEVKHEKEKEANGLSGKSVEWHFSQFETNFKEERAVFSC